jgi:hypothetical protein
VVHGFLTAGCPIERRPGDVVPTGQMICRKPAGRCVRDAGDNHQSRVSRSLRLLERLRFQSSLTPASQNHRKKKPTQSRRRGQGAAPVTAAAVRPARTGPLDTDMERGALRFALAGFLLSHAVMLLEYVHKITRPCRTTPASPFIGHDRAYLDRTREVLRTCTAPLLCQQITHGLITLLGHTLTPHPRAIGHARHTTKKPHPKVRLNVRVPVF